MSGLFDRLARGLQRRDETGVDGGAAQATGGAGLDSGLDPRIATGADLAHQSQPTPAGEATDSTVTPDDYRDGNHPYTEPRDAAAYRDGNHPYTEPRDAGDYRDGNHPYTEPRDAGDYRDGNALPPSPAGDLAYRSDDVVESEAAQSGQLEAPMTDTVVSDGSDLPAPDGAVPSFDPSPGGGELRFGDGLSGAVPSGDESPSLDARYEYGAAGEADSTVSPVDAGDLAYRTDDVVESEPPESGPLQARMTDTVVADGGGEEAVAGGGPVLDSTGAPTGASMLPDSVDMSGAEAASPDVLPTEELSLNDDDVEYDYATADKEGSLDSGGVDHAYEIEEHGEPARDSDQPDGKSEQFSAEPAGDLVYRSDDVVESEPPESGQLQARMTDTIVSDDDEKATDDGSGGEPTVAYGQGSAVHSEPDDEPLTLINFDAKGDVPAVIEESGADLEIDGGAELVDLGAGDDDLAIDD